MKITLTPFTISTLKMMMLTVIYPPTTYPLWQILLLRHLFMMTKLTSNPTGPSMGWGMQFLRNSFHLLESSMKFQVQLNLVSLKLMSSPANTLLRFFPFILIFFRYGVRLPLHPFVRYMLICLNCALAQLSPSVWCAMIGMCILWKLRGFPNPTFSQFQRIYQLMSLSGDKDPLLKSWYYVRAWAKSSPLIAQGKSHDGS